MSNEEIIKILNNEIPLDNTDADNYDIFTYLTGNDNIKKITILLAYEYPIPEKCRIITDRSTGSMYMLSYNDSSHAYNAIKLKDLDTLATIVDNIKNLHDIINETIIPLYKHKSSKLYRNAVRIYTLQDFIMDIYSTIPGNTVYNTIVLNALNSPQTYFDNYEDIKEKIKRAKDLKNQLDEQLDDTCKVSFLSQNTKVNTDIETDTNISTNTESDHIEIADRFGDLL